MSIQKTISGGWLFSTIYNNQYVKQTYFYYTKKEARALFLQYLKTL